MTTYIQVVEDLADDEVIELPVEPNGTMLLSTLTAQFPFASGLKYRNPDTGSLRGLRVMEGSIQPPDDVWGDHLYIAVFPKDNKRKGDDNQEKNSAKTRRVEPVGMQKTVDLIVLGLAWKTTQAGMREYFKQFGELLICELKVDADKNSKGFGFVRFKEVDVQNHVVSIRHTIDGRNCDVKFPDSKNHNNKMFIGRMTPEMTREDVLDYFSQFGEVIDVYIPKTFRGFGFITFRRPEVAALVASEDHILKGTSLFLSDAEPKNQRKFGPNSPENKLMGFDHQHPFLSRGDFNQGGRRGGRSGGGGGGNFRDQGSMGGGGGTSTVPSNGMGGSGANMGGGNPGGPGPGQMGNFPWNQAMLAALSQAGWGMMSNMLAQGMQQGMQQTNPNGSNNQQQQQQTPQGNGPSGSSGGGGGGSSTGVGGGMQMQQPMQQQQQQQPSSGGSNGGGGGAGSSSGPGYGGPGNQQSLSWGGGQNPNTEPSNPTYMIGDNKTGGSW